MQLLRRTFYSPAWNAIANLPPAKLLALLLMIVAPGGLLVPACYVAYRTIRRSRTH